MSRARASFFEVPQPVREPPPTFDDLIFLCVAITDIFSPFLTLFKNCQFIEHKPPTCYNSHVTYSKRYSQKKDVIK